MQIKYLFMAQTIYEANERLNDPLSPFCIALMLCSCPLCAIGWNRTLHCKSCHVRWNGSHLILGSMYSYDIFAAVPCCPDRLRCNNCQHLVIPPERRMEFFSDYSHSMPCSHCGIVDHHFIKPLAQTYVQCE